MDPRQAHKAPERRVVVFGTPDEREANALVLFTHRPEDDAGIGHSAPVLGYKTDAEPETHQVHDPLTALLTTGIGRSSKTLAAASTLLLRPSCLYWDREKH